MTTQFHRDFQPRQYETREPHLSNNSLSLSLFKAFVKRGSFTASLSLFNQLRQHGLWPDNYTYPYVLKAIGCMGDAAQGEKVHAFVIKTGLEFDAYVCNSLMEMYAQLGRLRCVKQLFEEMPHRDNVSWNIMISGCVRCMRFQEAVEVFQRMRMESNEKPSEATVVSTLTACAVLRNVEVGKEIHSYIEKELDFTIIMGNALLDMYCKCGYVSVAREIFDGMAEKNVNFPFTESRRSRYPFRLEKTHCRVMTMLGKAREGVAPLMKVVRLKGMCILEQLHLEERLLRTSSDNWCLINDGTTSPAIVMGLSGKLSELVEAKSVLRDHIPVIRRFTGGGTVIVDNDTIFVTLICNKDAVPNVQPFPRPIMSWSGLLYDKVFAGLADFHLRENDYVFGDRKFGGNAQSITKNRWIHHTSFLWDYEVKNMSYLKLPAKAPKYRLTRDHTDFICRMKEHMPRSEFIERTIKAVGDEFSVSPVSLESINIDSVSEYVHTTKLLTEHEIREASVLQT